MRVLSLQSLVLLSLLGQSIFILGVTGSHFSRIEPSDFGQTLPPSKNTLSFLIEEELYQNLPDTQIIHRISIFLKELPPQSPSLVSCKNLGLESIENPIYIFINNLQPELFVAYSCDETNIKAIVTVNQNLLENVDTSEETVDYAVYVGSVCSEGKYNFMLGECTFLVRKRGLDLTQDQQELHDYYQELKSNGVPGAIGICYGRDEMYKELFDEMVSDLSLYVNQVNIPNFDWTDSVSAVVSLLSLNFASDTQADTLYNLATYIYPPFAGPFENFLNIFQLYLFHYRKYDQSVNYIFLKKLENVDIRIRQSAFSYYSFNYNTCEIGRSSSFSSYTEGISRITISIVNLRTDESYNRCFCSYYCLSCPTKITITYEHISQFSELSSVSIAELFWINNQDCTDMYNSISVALYSESLDWNCFSSAGVCTGLAIKDSVATYTQKYPGISLLYPSTCIGNTVMDPNSNLCCFENCESCITETTCSFCKQGYTLTADKTQCGCNGLTHCSLCKDSLDLCEVCEPSYILQNDGTCYPKCGSNAGCASCSDDTSVCYQCDEGYYLKNQVCATCDSYLNACSTCGDRSIDYAYYGEYNLYCYKCKPYNALLGTQCLYCSAINNCINCDLAGQTCSRCQLGYFLYQNNCNKCSNTFANCAECGIYGENCHKCENMYAMQANNTCLKCNGIANCETCDSAGLVCSTCISGMYFKDNACAYCKDDYVNCTECSIVSGCTSCIAPLAALNGECVPGYQYLNQNHVSSSFDENYNKIILTFLYKIPIFNNCSIIMNPSILGENPYCNFVSEHQIIIVLGLSWNITETSDLYLDPSTLTLNGPYYVMPSSEIKTHPRYPNTNNIPPNAVIEGMSNILGSCQKLSISYTSSKSYGVALNTFTYLWWTDLPSSSAIIADPTLPKLYITDFIHAFNFNVFLQVSNIFGRSSIAQYFVTVDPTQLKITVALDTGDRLKIMYPKILTVQARIVDFCGIIGTATYSWSISDSYIYMRCYLHKCFFDRNIFRPENSYSLQVVAQISNSLGVYQSTATTIITSEYQQPSARIDRSSGELVLGKYPNDDPIYYYSWSNDPNLLNLAYSWSSTIPGYENLGNNNFVSLTKRNIWTSLVTEFDLTLKVDNGYKSSSTTIHLNVIKDIDPLITVNLYVDYYSNLYWYYNNGNKKAPKSSRINIWANYYYPYNPDGNYYPITFQWYAIPLIPLSGPYASYISIPSSSLNSGTYFFTVVAKVNGMSNTAYTSLTINAGATCPLDAVKFSPLSGIKTSTPLTFTISNCRDYDAEDLPLKYTFGYSTATIKRVTYVTSASYNTEYSFKFPSGTIFGNFTICDSLNDCTFAVSSPATVVKGRLRNLKDSAWIYDEYKQESQMYELPAVITYFLESYEIPDDLIGIMWSNFTEYINYQMMDIDLFMIVESIAFQFINYQTISIKFERLEAYINFVRVCLKELKEIDVDEDLRVVELADLILDVSLEMPYVILANDLLNTLMGLNDMPVSAPHIQNTSRFALLCVEDVVSQLSNTSFSIGALGLEVFNASIPSTSMLEVKAVVYSLGNYSDIFSVSFKSNKALKNNSVTNDTCEVSLKKGDVLFEVPVSNNKVRCIMWNNLEWVEEGCSIIETADGKSKVSVTKSGIYTLITVSSEYLRVPLYCITSLILLALILVALFGYLDKSQNEIEIDTQCTTKREQNNVTELELAQPEKASPVAPIKPKSYHLLISLLKPHEIFTRAKRIILLISDLSIMIYFSNLILSKISISPFISGAFVSVSVFPLTLLVTILLSKIGRIRNIIGVSIMIVMCLVAAVGIFFLQAQSGWWISFLVSVAIEFSVSQTLTMLLMRVIS